MIVITIGDSVLSKPFSLQENLLIDQLCFEKCANLTDVFSVIIEKHFYALELELEC